MSGDNWEVVRVEQLSPSRRRLWYVLNGEASVPATIDTERDTPAMRAKIADTLLTERYRVQRPDGARPYTPGKLPPSLGG